MTRRQIAYKTEHGWFAKIQDVGEPPTLRWAGFQVAFGGAFRQPENGVTALWLALGVALTMRFMPAGHLLFFASPKNENLHSLSARLLLHSLSTPTALASQVNRTTINLACRLVFVPTEYKIRSRR